MLSYLGKDNFLCNNFWIRVQIRIQNYLCTYLPDEDLDQWIIPNPTVSEFTVLDAWCSRFLLAKMGDQLGQFDVKCQSRHVAVHVSKNVKMLESLTSEHIWVLPIFFFLELQYAIGNMLLDVCFYTKRGIPGYLFLLVTKVLLRHYTVHTSCLCQSYLDVPRHFIHNYPLQTTRT
jgi:hypothetical protein